MTLFSITVYNEATMTATEHTVTADTEAGAVEKLAGQLKAVRPCEISFPHTSYFCGSPNCPAA